MQAVKSLRNHRAPHREYSPGADIRPRSADPLLEARRAVIAWLMTYGGNSEEKIRRVMAMVGLTLTLPHRAVVVSVRKSMARARPVPTRRAGPPVWTDAPIDAGKGATEPPTGKLGRW